MNSVAEENGAGTAEKKGRRPLPAMDVSAVAEAAPELVEPEPAVAVVAEAAPTADDPRVAKLEARLATTTQYAQIGIGVSVAALLLSISAPWWQPRAFDNDLATRQAAVLASVQVAQLAAQDAPFSSQLSALARALPQDRATADVVAAIAPLAASGVPTFETLNDRFSGTADKVLVGKVVAKNDESWLNWSVHKVAALVRIDTLAETVSAPPADVVMVHEAEAALNERDLSGAVERLSRLEGSSAEVVRSWLSDARARVLLDKEVAILALQAEKRIAGTAWLR